MAHLDLFRSAPQRMGWDLQEESLWTGSGPGRLFISVALNSVVSVGVLGHHAVRSRWPWSASMGLTAGLAFVLGMVLWGYWFLIRKTRKTLVPALRRGEKGYFRSEKGSLAIWAPMMLIVIGILLTAKHLGVPTELLFLGMFPFGLINGIESGNAYRETARLGFELREGTLRSKLAPHFIFNTLNTLHAQIENDPQGAQSTTEKLADLFRTVLAVSDRPTIPLKNELAFVEAYLGIEQARLGDRLRVSILIPEELESAEIPPLSLQVLVENAVNHGVAPLEQGGELRIGADRQDDFLRLWVEDPGPGFSSYKGTGTALETLRQRLEKPDDLEMGMAVGRHRVAFCWRLV